MVFIISRLCEEFGYRPEEAWRAWRTAPEGFLEQVMEARAYAATKAAQDRATTRKEQPTGATADLVREIELELAQDDLAMEHTGGQPAD